MLLLVLILALSVPDLWQAGRRDDVPLLQQGRREALQAVAAEGAKEAWPGVALADLYLVAHFQAQGLPDSARTYLEEALRILEQARKDTVSPDLLAFLGNFYGVRISFASWFQAPFLGRKAHRCLAQAQALDSLNPRVWLFEGIQAFYTPPMFGGGLKKAVRRLRRALELWQRRPASPLFGRWGEDLALVYLAQAWYRLGEVSRARATLQEALQRYPDLLMAHSLQARWAQTPKEESP